MAPRVLSSLLVACGLTAVSADLPVHCLRHQVVGDWEFSLGELSSQRSSCGHQHPDSQDSQPTVELSSTTKKKVTLSEPNSASSDDGSSGTWTMIYDEGFEVQLGDNTLFAFSHYSYTDDGMGGKKNISHCGKTQLGWYHTADRSQWGCWYASKTLKSAAPADSLVSYTPGQTQKTWSYDTPLGEEWHQSVVDRLNLMQKSWNAKLYPHMVGKTPRQLNKKAGIRRTHPISDMVKSARTGSFANSLVQTRRSLLQKTATSMPDTFDWRNVNGQSYLDEVMNQGDCGSCYTVSTLRMLSARNRVRTNNPQAEPFSISVPLFCAEYNQGCDGGYAFLASKWSEDVGLVPQSCAPYTTAGKCEVAPGCAMEKRYRAANHHYVGSYYGGSSEMEMMQELREGGPMVVSLEPKDDLMYYNNGIYTSSEDQIHQEWERVDHAVLLVGWGEENGKKYWTIQNSWGQQWGEAGFFRIARGSNDSGVESIAVAADVIEDDHPEVMDNFIRSL